MCVCEREKEREEASKRERASAYTEEKHMMWIDGRRCVGKGENERTWCVCEGGGRWGGWVTSES